MKKPQAAAMIAALLLLGGCANLAQMGQERGHKFLTLRAMEGENLFARIVENVTEEDAASEESVVTRTRDIYLWIAREEVSGKLVLVECDAVKQPWCMRYPVDWTFKLEEFERRTLEPPVVRGSEQRQFDEVLIVDRIHSAKERGKGK